jgi:hypothetical protein
MIKKTLHCDNKGCSNSLELPSESMCMHDIVIAAKSQGWAIEFARHLCPECIEKGWEIQHKYNTDVKHKQSITVRLNQRLKGKDRPEEVFPICGRLIKNK